MKPMLATCIGLYAYPPNRHIHFQIKFNNDIEIILVIKTESNHRYCAIESQLNHQAWVAWKKNSWQNALLIAWRKYIRIVGYNMTDTDNMKFKLIERADGSYAYDLITETKQKVWESHPIFAIFKNHQTNEDEQQVKIVSLIKEPTWFSDTPKI